MNEQSTIAPLLIDSRTAAKSLSISERTLFSLAERGELHKIHVGRAVRYSVDELKNWIAKKSFAGTENSQEST